MHEKYEGCFEILRPSAIEVTTLFIGTNTNLFLELSQLFYAN